MSELGYESIVANLTEKLRSEFKLKADLADTTDVLNLGLDSLDVMSYIFFIEETYDITINEDNIEDSGLLVIGNTANYILSKRTGAAG